MKKMVGKVLSNLCVSTQAFVITHPINRKCALSIEFSQAVMGGRGRGFQAYPGEPPLETTNKLVSKDDTVCSDILLSSVRATGKGGKQRRLVG